MILLAYNFLCNHVKPNGIPLCYDNSYTFHMYISYLLKTGGWSNKGPKHVVLLVIKDNKKDTYIVVFDGFINILYLYFNSLCLIPMP